MKNYLFTIPFARHLLNLLLINGLMLALPAGAAPVVLAPSPLVNSTSSVVKPNVMLMLDDSGSMAWDYMPDATKDFDGKYGYYSSQCNGVYYNPATTYDPPVYADGTSYPISTFSNAWVDGYNTGAGTINLGTSFTGGSGSGNSGSSLSATSAFYYTYSGAQDTATEQDYFNTSGTFYTECNTNALTSGIPNSGNGTFTKVTVTAASAEAGNFANWYSYYSHRMLMMKTGVGQAFRNVDSRYRLGFMSLNNNASPSFTNIGDFNAAQRSAWYDKLYGATTGSSTPLREALSKIGNLYAYKFSGSTTYTATLTVSGSGSTSVSHITVNGFEILDATTSSKTATSDVAKEIAKQIDNKNTDYTTSRSGNVVTITYTGPTAPTGYTPVITQSGGMTITPTAFVAHVTPPSLNGVTPTDPMQYSCQKNFVILSTDGYWNGNAGYKLDGSAIGNQDGIYARPYFDGSSLSRIVATLRWKTKQQQTTGALQFATKQQITSDTLTWATKQQQATAPLQWATNLQKTTAKLMKSTLGGTYTRTRGVMQVSNNGTSGWVNASASTTYTCITSGTGSGSTKYCRVPTTSDNTGQTSCTVSFNNPGSSTTDSSRRVITACTPEWSTPANVGNNGTCVASATVQCSTGTASTAYITTYPPACTVNFNTAGSSTADGSGNVITNCTVNASYNPTKTPVGANGTCNGALANMECSTGTSANTYTTFAAPTCTANFNATGLNTADAAGKVAVSCSVSGTFGGTTNLTAGQTCTGGGDIQCGTTAPTTAYVTTYPGTCATTYNGATGTTTANAAGKVVTACPVSASFNPTKTSVGAGGTCDGSLANMQCSNAGTAAYATFAVPNCTPTFNAAGSSTANGSGNVTSCSVSTSFSTPTDLVAGQTCSGGGNVECAIGSTSTVATTACNISYNGNLGTSTADSSGVVTTGCTASGGTSDTLADTAMYYYQTDLRDSALTNCTGAAGLDVCENNVPSSDIDTNERQHVTTYGLGLGARGKMVFSPSYLADTSGDFYDVKMGTTASSPICSWQPSGACNWPNPGTGGSPTTIDDLWHAAVNGRGDYFNATNIDTLKAGVNHMLSSIDQEFGRAAAAATSTLNPVENNNYAYIASYTTAKWKGNLERRRIDVVTGNMLSDTTWCVENISPSTCGGGHVVVPDGGNHYCSPLATDVNSDTVIDAADCTLPRVFDSASRTCRDASADTYTVTCSGSLPGRISVGPAVSPTATCNSLTPTDCDTRRIFTNSGSSFVSFDSAYATANPNNFSESHIAGLSQWTSLTASQKTAASTNLINFLRGRNNYEETRSGNPNDWLYRYRDAVMGDVLESQPVYVGPPAFNYPDAGYATFKANNALRPKTVYVGANDGMLHAFNAETGAERWAYVPSVIIPNMYKLADTAYSGQHVNYINGSAAISDICPTAPSTACSAAQWKTILVGGLNAGGRGYYALDVTDPDNPNMLWEFTAADDVNLGYTFGKPVVAKKEDGTWVVVVTSGYDNGTLSPDNTTSNSPTGDGLGHLYVLNANTGAIISNLATTAGSTTTPSGLAKFNIHNNTPGGDLSLNSLAGLAYAGDLEGNVWRFDINTAVTADQVTRLAKLYSDTSGTVPQPITVAPTIGLVDANKVIFVGTGKYLEASDLSSTQTQSLYAIKDDGTTLTNPRATLVEKTLANSSSTTRSTTDTNIVNFATDRGWFVDFPDTGERTNIDFLLVRSKLVVPTIVPSNTACSPGGYGWLNAFDYRTGVANGEKFLSPIVGVNVVYNSAGVPVFSAVLAEGRVSGGIDLGIPPPTGSGFQKVRSGWRELIPE